jgi:arginyl-tRNA synthetase
VLDEAHARALEIIRNKNPELKNANEVAEMIGLGAILFSDLSQNRAHDVNFDWEKALSFEGDTAPFVQYTHARCASLLRRCEEPLKALGAESAEKARAERAELLEHESVRQLVGDLWFFETYLDKAYQQRDPSQIATALLNISKSMNQLYHKIRFLDERSHARLETLLELSRTTLKVLAQGLKLLGISAPLEM